MNTAERLQDLNEALARMDTVLPDLRAFVAQHVNEETGEIKPMEASEIPTLLPAMLQRVTIGMEAMRSLILDGMLR